MAGTFLGMTAAEWLLWTAIAVGITTRCLNMWAYGEEARRLAAFRHDRPAFRVLLPASGLVIGALAWSWGTHGSALANLVLAVAACFPAVVRRQRWLAVLAGAPAGLAALFVLLPAALVLFGPSGSWAERVQLAGGLQLIVGFLAMLAGAWDGDRSADTWRWLLICLSVDAMLGAGAVALAATPIIALEVLALGLDLAKLRRKVHDHLPRSVEPARAPLAGEPIVGRVLVEELLVEELLVEELAAARMTGAQVRRPGRVMPPRVPDGVLATAAVPAAAFGAG